MYVLYNTVRILMSVRLSVVADTRAEYLIVHIISCTHKTYRSSRAIDTYDDELSLVEAIRILTFVS